MTLDKMKPGESAKIVDITHEGATLQRFLDMGFVEDTIVKVLRKAPLLDPIDIEIRGSLVAVRHSEASGIIVREVTRL